ncbi:MAG: hypothetical protein ACXW1D_00215 [Halobacteriota archaeon]
MTNRYGPDGQIEILLENVCRSGNDWDCLVVCHVCAKDVELFGNAEFVMRRHNALKGNVPCGCSKSYIWSEAQYEIKIQRFCESNGYIFIRFDEDNWSGVHTRITLRCEELHKEWTTTIHRLLNTGTGCPSCAKSGFDRNKPAYLYVFKAASDYLNFCGYGVTNNFTQRFATHKTTFKKAGIVLSEVQKYLLSGESAWEIEQQIRKIFKVGAVALDGFKWENTGVENYEDVVQFIESNIKGEN